MMSNIDSTSRPLFMDTSVEGRKKSSGSNMNSLTEGHEEPSLSNFVRVPLSDILEGGKGRALNCLEIPNKGVVLPHNIS